MTDRAILVPLVVVILALAVYPQVALRKSEGATRATVAAAHGARLVARNGWTSYAPLRVSYRAPHR